MTTYHQKVTKSRFKADSVNNQRKLGNQLLGIGFAGLALFIATAAITPQFDWNRNSVQVAALKCTKKAAHQLSGLLLSFRPSD